MLKKKQVEQLVIRAGVDGVLQQLGAGAPAPPLEVGQRVAPGTILAKVAQPSRLKAELQIPETQAKDVTLGQVASIDTRNGIIAGHVIAQRSGGDQRNHHGGCQPGRAPAGRRGTRPQR